MRATDRPLFRWLSAGAFVVALASGPSVACTGSSGNERFAFVAEAGAVSRDSTSEFTNDFGWEVVLSRATMRLGPIYLNTVAPVRASRGFRLIREARADDSHLGNGLIVGEVLGDVEVDLLSPSLTPFPVRGQVTGDEVRTAEIRFWPGAGIDPESPTTTPVLSVAGTARREGESIRFEGTLVLDQTWLPNAAPGDRNFLTLADIRAVRGIPAPITAQEGGVLEVRVDPRRLFATANFAQIRDNPRVPTNPDVRSLVQGSGTDQVTRSLYDAVRSIRTYEIRWRPAGAAPLARSAKQSASLSQTKPSFVPRESSSWAAPRGVGSGLRTSAGSSLVPRRRASHAQSSEDSMPSLRFTDIRTLSLALAASLLSAATLGGCSDDNEADPAIVAQGKAGSAGQTTAPGGSDDPGPGGFWITVSGEDLSLNGYPFVPGVSQSADPAFVDGWAVSFSHVILTVGDLELFEDPAKNPGDPKDVGAEVAHDHRLFAVDLHRGGPQTDKGSGQPGAIPIAAFVKKENGEAFDPTARYAFSYGVKAASADALQVNLDEEGKSLYQEAVTRGWSTIVVGTATYQGPAPAAGSVFDKLPRTVRFKLGLSTPARYQNCENPDFPAAGGEFPRGVQVLPNKSSLVQITYHTDHMFWDGLNVEGTPLHFDPIAAAANEAGDVTIDDLENLDFLAFTLRDGTPLPARSVVGDYAAPPGQLSFSGGGESFTKNSYAAFFRYSATSGGHLNADGECAVTDASGGEIGHDHDHDE